MPKPPEDEHPSLPPDAKLEQSKTSPDNQGLSHAPLAKRSDPLQERFSIDIPAEIPGVPSTTSDDASNQARMFALRQLFLENPSGRRFTWIPQAIEACKRSLNSDFLPAFGTIRSLEVDPSTSTITIITAPPKEGVSGDSRGDRKYRFELSFKDLGKYSFEYALQEAEQQEPSPELPYSPEMRTAIENLSPSAKYRWELIARASYQQAQGHEATTHGSFRVNPVGSDMMLRIPEGVGVFLDNDRAGHAQRFSVLKITDAEVPLTPQEQQWMNEFERMLRIRNPATVSQELKDFLDIVRNVSYKLMKLHEAQGPVIDILERCAGFLGVTTVASMDQEFRRLEARLEYLSTELLVLQDGLKKAIYTAKGTFRSDHPFELTELPLELRQKIQAIIDEWITTATHAHNFLESRREALLPLMGQGDQKLLSTLAPLRKGVLPGVLKGLLPSGEKSSINYL